MNTSVSKFIFCAAAALLFVAAQRLSLAGSATWATNPTSGDWNTAANWKPQTVPNSTTDVATFGMSNVTNLSITDASVSLGSAVFKSSAPPYTLTIQIYNLLFYGAGIVNSSGSLLSINAPEVDDNNAAFFFYNSASAGNMTSYSTVGGLFVFYGGSSAGSATFNLSSGSLQADIDFNDNSTAGNATINASASSVIEFFDSSTGGNSTFNLSSAAFVLFASNNNAEEMIGNCIGGAGPFPSQFDFEGFSSAGEGTFTAVGGSTSGEPGGLILFDNTATANDATFVINGGMGAGLSGTTLEFIDTTTAAAANITANGGLDGSKGGLISLQKTFTGGTCSITLNGNATFDLTKHTAGLTIGSLAGEGSVTLGANTLTIGSNNLSTSFSGVTSGTGGMSKSGTGTLTLSGANTYTGNTTVSAGVLVANTKRASSTGTGSVNVNAGTLGGKGMISGPVTIGTGSGSGAFLASSVGLRQPTTLSLSNTLTFQSDSTYTCQLSTSKKTADEVIAKGVTIASGAQFNLQTAGSKKLTSGTVFTVISNTASTPISGTFANLADGATLTVGRSTLKASYEGGDGNDLTLTVL